MPGKHTKQYIERQRQRELASMNAQPGDNTREKYVYVYDRNSVFDRLIMWDVEITAKLGLCTSEKAQYGHLRPLMKFLELSCHGVPWFIWVTVILLSSQDLKLLEVMSNLFLALVVDVIFITVLKTLIRRDRPSHNCMDMFATVSVDRYSFPSGHATRGVALGCFFLGQFKPATHWCLVIIVWVTAVCLSRVLLGRHHVLDVLCGVLVGMIEYPVVLYFWLSRVKCAELLSYFHPNLLNQLDNSPEFLG